MRRRRWRGGFVAVVAATLALPPLTAGAQEPTADDPGRSRQWALDRIGAAAGWSVATGEGVTIAVVDSGIDLNHPDLRDKIDATTDCVGNDDAPGGCLDGAGQDDAGHGTHVAGIAAASTNNGQGIAGVAPLARLLGVRVLANSCAAGTDPAGPDCEAEGTESDVAEGVRWAADHGADVINLSLGSVTQAVVGPGQRFAEALEYAWSLGAIPVLVAGNDLLLPGSLVDVPAVIVSATDRDDERTTYSNGVGQVRWGVAAPGGESDTARSCESGQPNGVLSTYFRPAAGGGGTSSYACVAGTSMAAPQVSGALAVLRSTGLAPEDAVERLLATATDLGPEGPDNTFGAGRIDLGAALASTTPTGQPVGAADNGGPTGVDVTTTVVTAATNGTTPPVVADPGPAIGTDAPLPPAAELPVAPPTTTGPVDTTPPVTTSTEERAAAAEQPLAPPIPDAPLPTGPLTIAVLAVAAVSGGHVWRYLATTNLGRRMPPREF